MGGTVTLVDANVWFSRTLRDWLCLCAMYSDDAMFSLAWTEDILAEVVYHLRKKYPMRSDAQIGGVRDRILKVVPHGRIAGYEIDDSRDYPDIFDAHVHAAAVHGSAGYVVTDDRRGFIEDDELPYEVYSADEFLLLIDDSNPALINVVLAEQIRYWSRREPSGFNLVRKLADARAPQFAERVRMRLNDLGHEGVSAIIAGESCP